MYDPYINMGRGASNETNEAYGGMLHDPSGFVNNILASYKPSEGYQFQKEELGKDLGNTAAAGGFAGTEYDQGVRGKLIQSLLSGDMQQYLTNVLGVHGQGLAGKEGIAGRGFNASGALADYLGSNLSQQAGLQFQGGRDRGASRSSYNDAMLGLGGNIAGGLWGNQPGKIWDGRGQGAGAPPGIGPVKGGYGGPYKANIPGAAWMS